MARQVTSWGRSTCRFASLSLVLLAGCGDQLPAKGEIGRWQMIPAGVGSAWRLDSETGRAEFCTFLAGAPTTPTTSQASGSLSCSAPIQAAGPNDRTYNPRTGKLEMAPQARMGWNLFGFDLGRRVPAEAAEKASYYHADGNRVAPKDVKHMTDAELLAKLGVTDLGVEDYPASLRPTPPPPKPGAVEDGYRFIGGDPSSKQSWTKLEDAKH